MSEKLTVGSLFAGIGGIELGLERTGGFETVWQVEKDDYCRRVLAKHWPDVNRYEDVQDVGSDELREVDLICGGFPCQNISLAGGGEGIEGERSGLWSEMWRCIRELRPRYALVENVPALRSRGLGRVLGDLAEIGYDAEWDCLPASTFGAPHKRDRAFIVAYPDSDGRESAGWGRTVCDENGERQGEVRRPQQQPGAGGNGQVFPDPGSPGRPQQFSPSFSGGPGHDSGQAGRGEGVGWSPEPGVGRVVDGVPYRVDRVRGLGNAVVPQVAEWIGEQILRAEGR